LPVFKAGRENLRRRSQQDIAVAGGSHITDNLAGRNGNAGGRKATRGIEEVALWRNSRVMTYELGVVYRRVTKKGIFGGGRGRRRRGTTGSDRFISPIVIGPSVP